MASANNLGTAYIRIAPQMKGIQSTITSALGGVGSKAAASFSNNFTAKWGKAAGAIAGITASVTSKALSAVTSSIDGAIKRVDTLNAFPKIMKNLGFETKESDSALSKLSERIEGLPTTLDEIVTYTQRLASTTGNLNKGIYSATNLAIAFNDAALAGGKGQDEANRAFEQFVQVVSRGRPSMQDWKIMMEVMPGQLKQLAKYLGVNSKGMQAYAKDAGKTADQLDGLDLYEWISEKKNAFAKERLAELQKAMIDLDNKGGAGIVSFKDQVGDATHTIGNALRLVPVRITKAMADVIKAFGTGDIYSTLDNFTSSFKKAGAFVVKYIVPPIKNDIIPILKGVIGAIKNVIKWVAETEVARETLAKLLKAFIAFKVVASIISTIKAVGVALAGVGAIMIKATATASTFTGVLSVGGGLGGALSAAAARSAQFATAGKSLSASMKVAGASATALTTKFAMLTVGIGALIAAGVGIYMGLTQIAANTEHAKKQSEYYQKQLINEKNATDNYNRSLQLQKQLLSDINNAKNEERDAEKELILAKQAVSSAQKSLNELQKAGKKGTDEYRLAEIELAEARERQVAATEALGKAKRKVTDAEQAEKDNRFTELNEINKLTLAEEIRAGKYNLVAKQLDELKKKTYEYRDANGKLVRGTKDDMAQTVDYLAQTMSRQDAAWRTIYENAKKNGTTFTEEMKKLGESGAKGLTGNFSTGVKKYAPLATEASKKLGTDIKTGFQGGLVGAIKEAANIGKRMAQSVIAWARKEADSHSPSRKMMEVGKDMAEGLNIGLGSMDKQLEQTAKATTATAIDAMAGQSSIGLSTGYKGVGTSNISPTQPAQVIQNNTFNQVANTLDVKEASRKLGWEVATAI